ATRPGKAERRPGKVEQRAGLTRRVPGQNLGATGRQALARRAQQSGRPGQASAPTPAVARDPDAERAAVDGFLAGFARAGSDGSTDGTSEEGT
ncbi:MAG: hypothetical protein J2P15_15690, partial [Micromonosporaceae bacterium]|nr:hypothetical protein [Micromonosporaceae bacterium]